VTLTLAKSVSVKGSVVFEGAAPLRPDALTVDTMPDVPAWSSRPAFARVAGDSTFTLEGLEHLPLYLVLRGLPDGWALKSVRYGNRDVTSEATDFTAGRVDRLQLVVTIRTASPSVKVVNERGEDVPASRVIAMPADPRQWTARFARTPATPAAGSVSPMGAMLPGEYLFAALSIDDYQLLMRNPSRLPSLAAVATKVMLGPGDTRVLALRVVPLPDR
jgi:hypothetical protein